MAVKAVMVSDLVPKVGNTALRGEDGEAVEPGRERVAVILVNWNGWADTIACVASVLRTARARTSIFICDNASTDNSVQHIRSWMAQNPFPDLAYFECKATATRTPGNDWLPADSHGDCVCLIENGGNLGFGGASNVGMRYALAAGYDYFWLLNNDTVVDVSTLPPMVSRMREDRNIGMCGSTLVYAAEPQTVQCLGGADFSNLKGRGRALGFKSKVSDPIDQTEIESRLRFVNGASMLVSRIFIEEVGLMEEDYFLYFEELDWAERGKAQFKLGYAAASVVRHKVGASIGTSDFGESSRLSAYYLARSRVRFCWRFYKVALPFVMLDLAKSAICIAVHGRWSVAVVVVRGALGLSIDRP